MNRHRAWIARVQGEIAKLLAGRTALIEVVTAGGAGTLVEQQDGQGALLRRVQSDVFSSWIGIDDHSLYYYERIWHKDRRWQTVRTPELTARIAALVGRVARLQAECKSAGRSWEGMVKAAVLGTD